MTAEAKTFGFVQFDFAGSLAVPDGRFLVRHPSRQPDVLIVESRPSKVPRARRFGKSPGEEPPEPEVGFTRVTVALGAHELDGESEITSWNRSINDRSQRDELVAEGLAIVNRAVHASAVARVEPHILERSRDSATAIRWGHGTGEELAAGRYSAAREETSKAGSRKSKAADAVGQERLAAILGGHEAVEPAETMILRARLDLNAGRFTEASLDIANAFALIDSAQWERDDKAQGDDLATLNEMRPEILEIAEDAKRRAPGHAESERLREAVQVAERLLRRRKARRG